MPNPSDRKKSTPLPLFVHVPTVLDTCREGNEGKAALQRMFDAARAEHARLPVGSAQDVFEAEAAQRIENEREKRREALLRRLLKEAEALRAERGAPMVIDASAIVAADMSLDVTEELVRRLDR
jgi:Skp family chaperone for outer membrane proteins